MRRLRLYPLGALLLALGAGCKEELTTPADCPDLCPGNSLVIRDTVIEARFDLDSTFTGYLSHAQVPALLISNGLPAGNARSWATFPRRLDSVTVDGLTHAVTVDSAAFTFNVIGRDSSVHGTELLVHRIPLGPDTTVTLAQLDAEMTAGSLIGAIEISDTGTARLVLSGEDLEKIEVVESDSFRMAIGLKIAAPSPTGIRLASLNFSRPPSLLLYGRIAVTDTAKQRQQLTLVADTANYVINTPTPPGQELLFLGGRRGTRAILRFEAPPALKDSAIILRATLELTPAGPILGLKNDPASLEVRGVLADVGAKSPYLTGLSASKPLPAGESGVVSIDVRPIVGTWFVEGAPPSALFIGINPEGGSFTFPIFFSTRSPTGRPRLRITYALPSRPGHP
jgi:hypothetical protein